MRYFTEADRESVCAIDGDAAADEYAADPAYIEISQAEFDDLVDSDPWRPELV